MVMGECVFVGEFWACGERSREVSLRGTFWARGFLCGEFELVV